MIGPKSHATFAAKIHPMRSFVLACLLVCTGQVSFGQPTTATFPDFTYTDITGDTHHLYGYLDAGKTVIVDVMATWCPLCVNSVPGLETIWEEHGPSGDDTMVVLSFERDANTTNEASWAATHGVTSPIITGAEDLIVNTWNIDYQPRYFVICPDGTFQFHVGAINANAAILTDLAAECAPAVSVAEASIWSEVFLDDTPPGGIRVAGLSSPAHFDLMESNGRVIASGTLDPGNATVGTTSLAAGVYMLRLSNGNDARVLRFVRR